MISLPLLFLAFLFLTNMTLIKKILKQLFLRRGQRINTTLILLVIAFITREIFLAATFPIFVGQDEARHYNTIQYYAYHQPVVCRQDEQGNYLLPKQDKQDLNTYRFSVEIREAAQITQSRVWRQEKYQRPWSVAEMNNGFGEEEFKQKTWPKRQELCPPDIVSEALIWPHGNLYHQSLALLERLWQDYDIFWRYYILRYVSVCLGALTLLGAYYFFRQSGLSKTIALLVTAIISFQPKFSVYYTNINYDALFIFWWTALLALSANVLRNGWRWWKLLLWLVIWWLAIATKATAMTAVGLLFFFLVYQGKRYYQHQSKRKRVWLIIGGGLTTLFLTGFLLRISHLDIFFRQYGVDNLTVYFSKSLGKITGYSRNYWGALGWGGQNLSEEFVWLIWISEWLAWLGLGLGLLISWRPSVVVILDNKLKNIFTFKTKFGDRIKRINCEQRFNKEKIIPWKFMGLASVAVVSLQAGIRLADWVVFQKIGRLALGMPGRYWLPNITAHFLLLVYGWRVIWCFIGRFLRINQDRLEIFFWQGFLVLMILYWVYEVFLLILPRFYF